MPACCSGCAGASLKAEGAGMHQVQVREGLYLFARPSTSAKVLGVVPNGTRVSRIVPAANGFARVYDPRRRVMGYLPASLLTKVGDGAGDISKIPFKGQGFYESTGSEVAVRAKPEISSPAYGAGSNAIGYLYPGDVVQADGKTQVSGPNTFAAVVTVFGPGWVSTSYLQPTDKTQISGGGPQGGGGGPAPGPGPAPQGGLAEESVFGSGWTLAGGLLLLAVAIYFVAK